MEFSRDKNLDFST